jgi:uncharacterized protein YyaL (SSP411 family)
MQDQVGFLDILKKIAAVWIDQEDKCLISAKEILQQLKDFAEQGNMSVAGGESDILDIELLEEAYQHFAAKYDKVHGGFGGVLNFF